MKNDTWRLAFVFSLAPIAVTTFALAAFPADAPAVDPSLRGTIGKDASGATGGSTIESVFDLGPVKHSKPVQDARAQAASLDERATAKESKEPAMKGMSRALWHVLDNVGVPMVFHKENDLDPAIDTSHWMPPAMVPDLKRVNAPSANPKQTVIESTAQIENGNIHKIPQSELEGIELPTLHDVQKPQE